MLIAVMVGLLLGLMASLPAAGPISALVLRHGLEGRIRQGAWTALGGALPDAGYAFAACWGSSTLLAELPWLPLSRAIAVPVLAGVGLSMLLREPGHTDAPRVAPRVGVRCFVAAFAISVLNPSLIGSWTLAISATRATGLVHFQPAQALPFAVGALIGMLGWSSVLLGALSRLRRRRPATWMHGVRRVVGAGLCLLALWLAALTVMDLT